MLEMIILRERQACLTCQRVFPPFPTSCSLFRNTRLYFMLYSALRIVTLSYFSSPNSISLIGSPDLA